MAHMIETMAYAGEVPWHGLGVPVTPDLSPYDILCAAGLDWQVNKQPMYIEHNGAQKMVEDKLALVRSTDGRVLSTCSKKYVPVQNDVAMDFFSKFVEAGRMTMETAGSLDNGARIWGLARMKSTDFALANDDKVEGYLLLCQPHIPGQSLIIQYTPIRVVCHNTLTMALNAGASQNGLFRMPHVKEFNADVKLQAETALGLSAERMKSFKESAEFLASKRATDDMVTEYFVRLYQPQLKEVTGGDDELSRRVIKLQQAYINQPGREMSEGSWWTAFNAVTYYQDHLAGHSANTRMRSSWFGEGGNKKRQALALALDYAQAA